MKLILASSSPRRASYLKELRIPFRKVVPEVDETRRPGESPRRYVRRLAVEKATTVSARHPTAWVVAADTTVVIDGRVLGKPKDRRQAKRMLSTLSGRSHRVMSGIALAHDATSTVASAVSVTRVFFRPLSNEEIDWYVDTGEPLDKAGAYGAQGRGGLLLSRIEGSFSNVVGFPLEKFYELARRVSLEAVGGAQFKSSTRAPRGLKTIIDTLPLSTASRRKSAKSKPK